MSMVGTTYLLRGQRVTVRARWLGNDCPRNVLIEFDDGSLSVPPFRGLRRLPASTTGDCGAPEKPVSGAGGFTGNQGGLT